jgi:hypothetical protein
MEGGSFKFKIIPSCKLLFLVFISFTFLSCSIGKQAEGKKFKINIVSSVEIPFNQNSKNTLIGGLSSIDYDPKGTLLFICDDRAFK